MENITKLFEGLRPKDDSALLSRLNALETKTKEHDGSILNLVNNLKDTVNKLSQTNATAVNAFNQSKNAQNQSKNAYDLAAKAFNDAANALNAAKTEAQAAYQAAKSDLDIKFNQAINTAKSEASAAYNAAKSDLNTKFNEAINISKSEAKAAFDSAVANTESKVNAVLNEAKLKAEEVAAAVETKVNTTIQTIKTETDKLITTAKGIADEAKALGQAAFSNAEIAFTNVQTAFEKTQEVFSNAVANVSTLGGGIAGTMDAVWEKIQYIKKCADKAYDWTFNNYVFGLRVPSPVHAFLWTVRCLRAIKDGFSYIGGGLAYTAALMKNMPEKTKADLIGIVNSVEGLAADIADDVKEAQTMAGYEQLQIEWKKPGPVGPIGPQGPPGPPGTTTVELSPEQQAEIEAYIAEQGGVLTAEQQAQLEAELEAQLAAQLAEQIEIVVPDIDIQFGKKDKKKGTFGIVRIL